MEDEESKAERLENLGKGFRAFVPSDKVAKGSQDGEDTAPVTEGICTYKGKTLIAIILYSLVGCVILIVGSVVDIKKLLGQLDRSEKARVDTEKKLTDVSKAHKELKDAAEKHAALKDRLQVHMIHCKLIRISYLTHDSLLRPRSES